MVHSIALPWDNFPEKWVSWICSHHVTWECIFKNSKHFYHFWLSLLWGVQPYSTQFWEPSFSVLPSLRPGVLAVLRSLASSPVSITSTGCRFSSCFLRYVKWLHFICGLPSPSTSTFPSGFYFHRKSLYSWLWPDFPSFLHCPTGWGRIWRIAFLYLSSI